jgi:phospholipid/cholesterol/gamma-HCH transport system permease protein
MIERMETIVKSDDSWWIERARRVRAVLGFSARVILESPRALVFRFGDFVRQFERIAWGTAPLVFIAGLSVGLVTWLQTRRLLVGYSLEATTPGILLVAVVVETGPILAGLLLAGRVGAGLAAELGSMSLTEELDAREVLGAPVILTLVAPRVLACVAAAPLLTILIDAAALLGGLLGESCWGSISSEAFLARSFDYLKLADAIPATLKTAAFGLLIGIVACRAGLTAERSTDAVGRAATHGVVAAALAIFIANAALVPLIQAATAALDWNY